MSRFLRFEQVSFQYPGMTKALLSDLDAHFERGWTGIVGPNGAGKTTFLRLATGELEPSKGVIHHLASGLYAVQRTDDPPEGLEDFVEARDPEAIDLRVRLGIQDDWHGRWHTLSHGERKRLQIAVVLWANPEVLALDEPTNHIDASAREMLLDALKRYKGVGLLVSHDRELLDALCSQCLFIYPPKAVVRPGGVTAGMEQDRLEQESARKMDDQARDASRRLKKAAQAKREEAEHRAAVSKSSKHIKPSKKDHDGKAKRQLAKLTGKDAWAAKQSASLNKKAREVEASRANISIRKEYEMGFWLEGSGCSTRNSVLTVPAGEISLGENRRLVHPELYVSPTDRIALTGSNGLGKSTLLKHLLQHVAVPPERLISVPQEITAEEAKDILEETRSLPKDRLGFVMTSVSRLGSRPGRLLESEQPSPGEIRKLLLALGVNRGPHLIVMDEPTNHMDLPSIACLEDALAECPCAMILVSHDRVFLDKLTDYTWNLELQDDGRTVELVVGRRDAPPADWDPEQIWDQV
ncbi:MAG: ATP-binding cassette domain-containing protein [Kiritimatiellia bacterium]|jgi:macrolide transport system ATP-binding/permease protein|uniref:ATP-binding cassette domain-containing protein n=1 Tax=Atribacter sp. TaxID=2847780 RepID=UPI003D97A2C9